MQLSQTVIVIVGGASGMGAQTARYLRQQDKTIKIALLDIKENKSLVKEIDALFVPCDVADSKSSETAIHSVVAAFGEIHVCINCAGIVWGARIVGRSGPHSLDEFQRVIDINLVGTFNILRLSAHQMMTQAVRNEDGERGVIINTASIAAYEGQIGQAAYSASKGGVVALTLPAAREFAKYGIRVMTVAPGVIDTPMISHIGEAVRTHLEQDILFPHRLGKALEYARLVVTIIENIYLNGSVIRLDGGLRLSAS